MNNDTPKQRQNNHVSVTCFNLPPSSTVSHTIIVKDRLQAHIQFWKDIGAYGFILDTISDGYKIQFYSIPLPINIIIDKTKVLLPQV